MQLEFQNLNKYIKYFTLILICKNISAQSPAISGNVGYAASLLSGNSYHFNTPLINSISNGITAEYIFKTDQIGLGLEAGYIRKGIKEISIINNLSLCFKIKRYYKNNFFLSMGIGYDRFLNSITNTYYSENYTSNFIILKKFDLYIQPVLGYTIIKKDNLWITPNIGFDFSLFPINIENNKTNGHLPLLYNRYAFININILYKLKKKVENLKN